MEIKKIIISILLFFYISGMACIGFSLEEQAYIYPGEGVGHIELNMKYRKIREIIKAEFNLRALQKVSFGNESEVWVPYDSLGLVLICEDNDDQKIKRIMVKNKSLFVEGTNISVGSSLSELREQFEGQEREEYRDEQQKLITWDFKRSGIKFWISMEDFKIFTIEVKEKLTNSCDG